LVWGGTASVAMSRDAAQQEPLMSSISVVPEASGEGGCPYPDKAPSARDGTGGEARGEPEMAVPEYRPAPRGPVRPAVFYELYFPAESTNEPIDL
jgi:hypothetical protein